MFYLLIILIKFKDTSHISFTLFKSLKTVIMLVLVRPPPPPNCALYVLGMIVHTFVSTEFVGRSLGHLSTLHYFLVPYKIGN